MPPWAPRAALRRNPLNLAHLQGLAVSSGTPERSERTLQGLSPRILPFRTNSFQLLNTQTGHRQLPEGGSRLSTVRPGPTRPLQGPGPGMIRCTDHYRPAAPASSSPPTWASQPTPATWPHTPAPRFLHCSRPQRPQRPPCLSSLADSHVPEPLGPSPASRPRRHSVVSVFRASPERVTAKVPDGLRVALSSQGGLGPRMSCEPGGPSQRALCPVSKGRRAPEGDAWGTRRPRRPCAGGPAGS